MDLRVLLADPLCFLSCDFFALRIQAERNHMDAKTELELAFKEDCKVIYMAHEYPGYSEEIKCMILTDLSEQEVQKKYSSLLQQLHPFLVLPTTIKDAIDEYNRNEDKHKKRMIRNTGLFAIDEEAERLHTELSVPSADDIITANREKNDIQKRVNWTLSKLSTVQRRRLIKHYVHGMTWKEIGDDEGRSDRAIGFSIQAARKKFQKLWRKDFLNGTPLSKHSEGVISMSGAITSSDKSKNGEVL